MIRRAGLISFAFVSLLSGVLASGPVSASPPPSTVVQLGDSYSAGFGVLAGTIAAGTGSCTSPGYSAPSATPGGRLASESGARLVFAACGGAEVPDVVEQYRSIRESIPGDGIGTIIVFSAGGNDLRSVRGEMWTDLLQRCILLDLDCERRSQNQPANIDAVAHDLADLVAEIRATTPGATIRVMGYPELMQRTPGCWGMTGIDRREADFLDDIARDLNAALSEAVSSAASGGDVRYVDPTNMFDDRGACQTERSGLRYVNDVDFVPWSFTVAANSLHPNAAGYRAYADLLEASLDPR